MMAEDNLEDYDTDMEPQEPVAEPQEPAAEPQEQFVAEKPKWQWVGSSRSSDAKRHNDGISDLFRISSAEDKADVRDAVVTDINRDVLDSDADGGYSSLVSVSDEDVMGPESEDPLLGPELDYETPSPETGSSLPPMPAPRRVRRTRPPESTEGFQGMRY